jgi:hypothetical protein
MRLKEMSQSADENPESPDNKEEREHRKRENAKREAESIERQEQKYRWRIVPMRKEFVRLYNEIESIPCSPIFQVMIQAGIEQGLGLRRDIDVWEIATEILQSNETDIPGVDLCYRRKISSEFFYRTMTTIYRTIDKMLAAQNITEIDGKPIHTRKKSFDNYIVRYLVGDLSLEAGIVSGDNRAESEDEGGAGSIGQPTKPKPPNNPEGGGDPIYLGLANSEDSLPTECKVDNSEHSLAALSVDPEFISGFE